MKSANILKSKIMTYFENLITILFLSFLLPSDLSLNLYYCFYVKVTEEDLGQYEIKQHFSPNAVNISLREVSSPLDLRLVFIYISPVLSLLICLIVIIIAVCYVRKQKN